MLTSLLSNTVLCAYSCPSHADMSPPHTCAWSSRAPLLKYSSQPIPLFFWSLRDVYGFSKLLVVSLLFLFSCFCCCCYLRGVRVVESISKVMHLFVCVALIRSSGSVEGSCDDYGIVRALFNRLKWWPIFLVFVPKINRATLFI